MFVTDQIVPDSGIYMVSHAGHGLPGKTILLKNQRFPRCSLCVEAVSFEAVGFAPHMNNRNMIVVYELPELKQELRCSVSWLEVEAVIHNVRRHGGYDNLICGRSVLADSNS